MSIKYLYVYIYIYLYVYIYIYFIYIKDKNFEYIILPKNIFILYILKIIKV